METIRQGIIPDNEVKKLVNQMIEMPERLKSAENVLAEQEFKLSYFNDLANAKEAIKVIESEVAYEISLEMTESPGKKETDPLIKKPTFPNDTARQAELFRRLKDNQEHINAVGILDQAEKAKNQLVFDVAKSRNTMLAVKNEYFLLQSLSALIAGLCQEQSNLEKLENIAKIGSLINNVFIKNEVK